MGFYIIFTHTTVYSLAEISCKNIAKKTGPIKASSMSTKVLNKQEEMVCTKRRWVSDNSQVEINKKG